MVSLIARRARNQKGRIKCRKSNSGQKTNWRCFHGIRIAKKVIKYIARNIFVMI